MKHGADSDDDEQAPKRPPQDIQHTAAGTDQASTGRLMVAVAAKRRLILMRGLPGSGKSFLARQLAEKARYQSFAKSII